ncbi:MAG: hypothetical protein JWL64_1481 [Frankiales bacterium]|nr:hypothetical protein [Frankiales bacterium]
MFGKRKRGKDEIEIEELTAEEQATVDAEIAQRQLEADKRERALRRPEGPWDVRDQPADDVGRLDLGALRIPVQGQLEVRVDLNPEGQVVAATLVDGDSAVQVMVFAAPRTEGIWDDVRDEIAASLAASGGTSDVAEGAWGGELVASVPTQVEGGATILADTRFIGVDGPRWFLRALISGPAALDRQAAAGLEAAVRDIVVVRGDSPMAVRDPLPMHLPPEAEQARLEAAEQAAQSHGLGLPERGPEITETR